MALTTATSLGLAAAALVLLGSAIAGEKVVSRQDRTDRVTVLYWEKWTGSEGEEMRKVVDTYNASQHHIFVKYLSISNVDQKTLLATAGGNPPDIAGIWGNLVGQFVDAKALMDLTPMATDAGLTKEHYILGYWNMLNFDGRLYALPSTPATVAMHVNAELVPKENATPETFPQTFEGLDELTKRISKKNKDGSLKLAGFVPGEPGWWHWAWGYFYGGHVWDGEKFTLNSKENIAAFDWIAGYGKLFGNQSLQNFQSGFGNFSSSQDAFMVGKVASEIHGVYKANYIHLFNPKMKWFALPFPHPKYRPDLAGRTILDQDVYVIPRGAKHPKEAMEFLAYMQSQPVMERICMAHGKNSPLAKVSENFLTTHPNPFIRLFDQLAHSPQAFPPPKTGLFPQLNSEMGNAFTEVSAGRKTAKEALDDAQTRMEGLLATYKKQVLAQ